MIKKYSEIMINMVLASMARNNLCNEFVIDLKVTTRPIRITQWNHSRAIQG